MGLGKKALTPGLPRVNSRQIQGLNVLALGKASSHVIDDETYT